MAWSLLDDAIVLYPVYALLFVARGLSNGQISSLFIIWSGAATLLQIPAGALADRLPRRPLLAVAATSRGAGFALWLVAPSYAGFAAGFLLWSVKSALTTGTLEALVYDDLAAVGRTVEYSRVIGRAATARGLGLIAATGAATPLLAVGGYPLVGACSVAVCAGQAVLALSFPRAPRVTVPGEREGFAAYVATLRSGVTEAARRPGLRRLVVVSGLASGLLAVDEYLPLLARDAGAPDAQVPLLLLVPVIVGVAASAIVGWRRKWRVAAVPLLAAAVLIGSGALTGSAAGVIAAGLGCGIYPLAQLALEGRVQHAVTGTSRATITSVVDVLAETAALSVFAGFAVGSRWLATPTLFALDAVLIAAVAAYAGRTR